MEDGVRGRDSTEGCSSRHGSLAGKKNRRIRQVFGLKIERGWLLEERKFACFFFPPDKNTEEMRCAVDTRRGARFGFELGFFC